MRNAPIKPIESASVLFDGDPSIGIFPSSFKLELYIDPNCFCSTEEFFSFLEEVRRDIFNLYVNLGDGEPPSVFFDFELDRMGEDG